VFSNTKITPTNQKINHPTPGGITGPLEPKKAGLKRTLQAL
jgi:hypothetical protein